MPHAAPSPLQSVATHIYTEAIEACAVQQVFRKKLIRPAEPPYMLRLGDAKVVDLAQRTRVLVIAMGKAGAAMTQALLEQLAIRPDAEVRGILIAPERPAVLPRGFVFFAGGHPLPNQQSFAAAQAVLELLSEAVAETRAEQSFCFFLLSGGASAMLEMPLDASISFEDTVAFHQALIHSGASIAEINCVRKHFSAVKGGRLVQRLGSIPSVSLAVSDVPENNLHALASGPTVSDPSTLAECRAILARYDLLQRFPSAVATFFRAPTLPETPKFGAFPDAMYALLSATDLAAAAQQSAASLGFVSVVDNTCDDWEVSAAAKYLLERLRDLQGQHERVCLISVGEVTLRLPHKQEGEEPLPGLGGRNLQFALLCALLLRPEERIAVLSAGSDGVDGNSPAAGAVVDSGTATARIAEAQRALERFDAYTFLHTRGCTLITGPSGNNIRDLRVLVADRSARL